MARMRNMGLVCSVEGCERTARTKGVCEGHYQQLSAGRPFAPLQNRGGVRVGPCGVEGCPRPLRTSGLCHAHYQAHRKGKELKPLPPEGLTWDQRYWARVDKENGPIPDLAKYGDIGRCWAWCGNRSRLGYGRINTLQNGRQKFVWAHRYAWEQTHGPIGDGLELRHVCDTPFCVNPAHLTPGSHAQNMRGMRDRGRQVFQAHPERAKRGADNHNAKFTEEGVRELRERYARGTSICSLAREFGVGTSTMSRLIQRKTWKHVA